MVGIESCSPVHGFVVTFRGYHFWGKVIGCTTKRPGNIWHVFGKAEIRNLDMAVSVEKEVFGLEIPVDDVLRMQVFEGKCHFCCVELRDWIWKSLLELLASDCPPMVVDASACL